MPTTFLLHAPSISTSYGSIKDNWMMRILYCFKAITVPVGEPGAQLSSVKHLCAQNPEHHRKEERWAA